MKKIYKLFLLPVILVGSLFQSCETIELESLDNPNNLTSGDPIALLNNIQDRYRASQVIFNDRASEITRIDYMSGLEYFSAYTSATFNTPWRALYSSNIPDVAAIKAAETPENDLSYNIAMANILNAHITMQLVDFLGDIIPLSQAGNPEEFPLPTPTSDGGAASYGEALALLDEAIALLSTDPPSTNAQDLYYGGDAAAWTKLANTLKMRAALTTGDMTTFNSIASNPASHISSEADDFQFNFGTLLAPVNTQHQDYRADYTGSGANIYKSDWLMNLMLENNDPRIRYYYARQTDCTPGASCNPAGNVEVLQCSQESVPVHMSGTQSADIWCFLEEGYWGRLHGNNRGTPPDGFLRTATGSYPAGGYFDDDSYRNVNFGNAGAGLGFEPIILASYVDFWKAEAALAQGQPGTAAMHLENGLTKSIAKVQPTAALYDATADLSFEPSSADVTSYIDGMISDFNTGSSDAQWNILGEQFFTTLYGNGADAHNFYRRTGYPNTVSLNFGPNPGNYIRTFLYPDAEVSSNSNFQQRTDNDDAVFWNTQALPTSN